MSDESNGTENQSPRSEVSLSLATSNTRPPLVVSSPELAEYRCIRSEILDRIKLRQQILLTTMVVFGATMTMQNGRAAYPILAALIALAWLQNDARIKLLAKYIRDVYEYENNKYGFGWETYVERNRTLLWIANVIYPHGLIFLLTQSFSLVLIKDYYRSDDTDQHNLFTISGSALVFTIVLFVQKIHAERRLCLAPSNAPRNEKSD